MLQGVPKGVHPVEVWLPTSQGEVSMLVVYNAADMIYVQHVFHLMLILGESLHT